MGISAGFIPQVNATMSTLTSFWIIHLSLSWSSPLWVMMEMPLWTWTSSSSPCRSTGWMDRTSERASQSLQIKADLIMWAVHGLICRNHWTVPKLPGLIVTKNLLFQSQIKISFCGSQLYYAVLLFILKYLKSPTNYTIYKNMQ